MNQNDIYNLLKSLGIILNNTYSPAAYRKHKNRILPILQNYNFNLSSDNGSEHVYWITNNLQDYPKKCKTCENKITRFHSASRPYKFDFCSNSCAQSDKTIQQKSKETSRKRYGTDKPAQSENIKNKMKETTISKYGVDNYFQRSDLIKKSIKEKYGVDNISQVEEIKEKKKQTYLQRYGVESPIQFEETFDNYKNQEKRIQLKIGKLLDDLKIKYILNDRNTIKPKEIDILIPEYDLGIELNGLYFHSELFNKDKKYHLNKTIQCEKKNIRLLHIFEDELLYKKDIIHSILSNILGHNQKIYARKTKIITVDKITKKRFLKENHIQGNDNSSIYLGLEYQNELVAIMTFCKARFSKNHEWELTRFANKKNINVVGGASKLLKYFVKNYNPKNIITYADRRLSMGNMYYQLGFQLSHITPPNYSYVINGNRKNRMLFQKKNLKNKLKVFDPNLSEKENMKQNKYYRIWDCGHLTFVKNF